MKELRLRDEAICPGPDIDKWRQSWDSNMIFLTLEFMILVNIVFFKKQIRFLEERFDVKQLDDTEQNNWFRTLLIRQKILNCI